MGLLSGEAHGFVTGEGSFNRSHQAVSLPSLLRVALVMPVYNEGKTIEATVSEIEGKVLSKMPKASLYLFEDGSNDDTKEVLASLADPRRRIFVSTATERKGYPRAVREALTSVDKDRFDYALFLDSDGQYDPSDFWKLFEAASNDKADIIMGRRMNRVEPTYRVALSSGLRVIEKVLFGPPCKDVTSALRLIRVDAAKRIASEVRYSKYSFWLEFTARAAEEGYSTKEVAVAYRERPGDAKSNIYSVRKMPKVIYAELGAMIRTWWEYEGVQAMKFVGVGLSGAAVILAMSYLFTSYLGQNYLVSTGAAIEVSIVWAFVLNDKLTFGGNRNSRPWHARLGSYNLLSIGGLLLNELILYSLATGLRMYYLSAEFVAIASTFAFRYSTNTKWTWAKIAKPISLRQGEMFPSNEAQRSRAKPSLATAADNVMNPEVT